MKHWKLTQGSPQWQQARLGKPTASKFQDALKQARKKGEVSKTRVTYLYQLVAEQIFKQPMYRQPLVEAMEKGKENEPFAAAAFGLKKEWALEELGFITNDAGTIGCSPDRVVRDRPKEIVEIKCPLMPMYLRRLLEGENEFAKAHKAQLQGQLWVGEFQKVHLVGYGHGFDLPLICVEVERDEDFIDEMAASIEDLVAEIDHKVAEAKRRGVVIIPTAFVSPLEQHHAEGLARELGMDAVVQEQGDDDTV